MDGQVRIESRVDAVNARIDQMAMISVPDDKTVFLRQLPCKVDLNQFIVPSQSN